MTSEKRTALLTDAHFDAVAAMMYARTGIVLETAKKPMVQSRLAKRLRATGLLNFSEYLKSVEDAEGEEFGQMLSALTTNVTRFFREPHHFDYLIGEYRTKLEARLKQSEPLRIWSAGCSTGEEPYSIAGLFLNEFGPQSNFRILATDIDPQVVERARAGVYRPIDPASAFGRVNKTLFGNDFGLSSGTVASNVRKHIVFGTLNLISDWPMTKQFDLIFCRNVVIYFDAAIQARLWPRFQAALKPDGLLLLGHSERLDDPHQLGFEAVGTTIYKSNSRG